jgi:hypothetical protein
MKTKKFNLSWQSVLLGMVLCMVVVVFAGSNANTLTAQIEPQARVSQNAVTMNELFAKSDLIDQRIVSMERKIDRLREQMDYLLKNMEREWRKK